MNTTAQDIATKTQTKQVFNKRRNARILAVQSFYNMLLVPEDFKSIEQIVDESLQYGIATLDELDQKYFLNIITNTCKNVDFLRQTTQQYLSQNWKFERLPEVIKAIIILASYEIIYNVEVDVPVIIYEYIEIAKMFEYEKEAGFVNALLDKVYKQFPRIKS